MTTIFPTCTEISFPKFTDHRGSFRTLWKYDSEKNAPVFIQDNLVHSGKKGTLRGLHFQTPPFAQGKFITVLKGGILDVVVDIRKNSPDYGRVQSKIINQHNHFGLFIPKGFAHGYITTENDTLVLYKVDAAYSPQSERGILWNDRILNIDWGIGVNRSIIVSERDQKWPEFSNFHTPFTQESNGE